MQGLLPPPGALVYHKPMPSTSPSPPCSALASPASIPISGLLQSHLALPNPTITEVSLVPSSPTSSSPHLWAQHPGQRFGITEEMRHWGHGSQHLKSRNHHCVAWYCSPHLTDSISKANVPRAVQDFVSSKERGILGQKSLMDKQMDANHGRGWAELLRGWNISPPAGEGPWWAPVTSVLLWAVRFELLWFVLFLQQIKVNLRLNIQIV